MTFSPWDILLSEQKAEDHNCSSMQSIQCWCQVYRVTFHEEQIDLQVLALMISVMIINLRQIRLHYKLP